MRTREEKRTRYLLLAQECRELAKVAATEELRTQYLGLATSYEKLAKAERDEANA